MATCSDCLHGRQLPRNGARRAALVGGPSRDQTADSQVAFSGDRVRGCASGLIPPVSDPVVRVRRGYVSLSTGAEMVTRRPQGHGRRATGFWSTHADGSRGLTAGNRTPNVPPHRTQSTNACYTTGRETSATPDRRDVRSSNRRSHCRKAEGGPESPAGQPSHYVRRPLTSRPTSLSASRRPHYRANAATTLPDERPYRGAPPRGVRRDVSRLVSLEHLHYIHRDVTKPASARSRLGPVAVLPCRTAYRARRQTTCSRPMPSRDHESGLLSKSVSENRRRSTNRRRRPRRPL